MPAAISQMIEAKFGPDGRINEVSVKPEWAAFLSTLQQLTYAQTRYGTTADRPTSATKGRYIGMPYYDQTLGYVIFLQNTSSNTWIDANGVVV
jgi:hypothetical protein